MVVLERFPGQRYGLIGLLTHGVRICNHNIILIKRLKEHDEYGNILTSDAAWSESNEMVARVVAAGYPQG